MTLYFDTSFLAPLILRESTSARIERYVRRLPAEALAISHWTRVEFSSLLAREVRMGGLAPDAARAADQAFEDVVAESFIVLLPDGNDYALAKQYVQTYATGLRAGDALHLAIAKNHGAETIYSLDRMLLKAGKVLGLPVRTGIRLAGYPD